MFRAWLFSPLLITFKDSFMLCQYFKCFLYLVCYTTKVRFLFRLTTNSNVKFLLIFITFLSARLLGQSYKTYIDISKLLTIIFRAKTINKETVQP